MYQVTNSILSGLSPNLSHPPPSLKGARAAAYPGSLPVICILIIVLSIFIVSFDHQTQPVLAPSNESKDGLYLPPALLRA